jgi:lipopolysaccharide transport system permease protein
MINNRVFVIFTGMKTNLTYTVILPGRTCMRDYLAVVFGHRSLIRTFVIREIKAKYAQTYLGIIWSIIQAVVGLSIITFFFGYLMKIDTGLVPYPVFAFPGMIAWYYFSFIIGYSGSSLIQSRHLIQKLNFPKILLPISHALVGLVDFIIWTVLLILLMIILKQPLSFRLLAVPVFILAILVTGLSISVWLSALTVRYRDLLIIIPYIIGFGIFITPVFFPGTMVPEKFDWVLYLNPMAGVITGLRWCFMNTEPPSIQYLAGLVPVLVLLISGLFYFREIEVSIADEL